MNIILVWREYKILTAFGREISVTCLVRNELGKGDMLRKPDEVVFTMGSKGEELPYMPRQFPKGCWDITGVVQVKKPVSIGQNADGGPIYYIKGWKIYTNAHQKARVWTTHPGEKGPIYDSPSAQYVEDTGFLFHGSDSITTVGCGRVVDDKSLEFLALSIIDHRASGDTFQLEVI